MFEVQHWNVGCTLCDSPSSYLDEIGGSAPDRRVFMCSDTAYCRERREASEPARRAAGIRL
ncbi:alpha-D-ribose 1-methylphosphonate 5-phosphate C-P-lyase PhnJ [Bradyrhizobium cenepequi]|uniref:alpha-D-ribose 1-methylphosphonate 5-phosphate C-P-lyase PhnJ n=1 Tax=Bradyrhizobium cenepequi TaxID=2821403 RepID=UPI001CE2565C|nr:alpha-D-ribose 1-methylphosphonate 5-phosphate C-P-lyase PhnJ [Bradyrhizobium cenepequi]